MKRAAPDQSKSCLLVLLANFGVELLVPLRRVYEGAEVERFPSLPWSAGGAQLGFGISGNYLAPQGCLVWERLRA